MPVGVSRLYLDLTGMVFSGRQEGYLWVAPFRSMLTEYFTTEFTELTELVFMFFIPTFPLCFSEALCGDENIPRLRNSPDPRNAAAIYFFHSSKPNEKTQRIA